MTNQATVQYEQDQTYEALNKNTRGKVCRVSGKSPVLIWHRDSWVASCADHRPNPCLWKKDDFQKERYGAMVNHAMAVRPESMPMSVNEIKQFISPKATEAEAYIFLRFCQAQGLNPFVNDAYLIKYDERAKASIVIGIQALLKRAESNPNYQGYQAGVVVLRNGEPVDLQGSLVYKDSDVLIGGWAEVRRKDWDKPLKVTVSLPEYNKRQAQWTEKPATMIEKVALAQGLRRVFPQEVGRLFERQELETEVGEVESVIVETPSMPKATTLPATQQAPVAPEPGEGQAEVEKPPAAQPGTSFEKRLQALYDKAFTELGMDVVAVNTIAKKEGVDFTHTSTDLRAFWGLLKASIAPAIEGGRHDSFRGLRLVPKGTSGQGRPGPRGSDTRDMS